MARATDEDVYKLPFPNLSPAKTARLGVDAESTHIDRIVGELAKLPADHPLREAYLQDLQEAEDEADSFFRPTTRAPAEDEPSPDQGSPPPAGG